MNNSKAIAPHERRFVDLYSTIGTVLQTLFDSELEIVKHDTEIAEKLEDAFALLYVDYPYDIIHGTVTRINRQYDDGGEHFALQNTHGFYRFDNWVDAHKEALAISAKYGGRKP